MAKSQSCLTNQLVQLLKQAVREPEQYPELGVQNSLQDLLDQKLDELDSFLSVIDHFLLSRGIALNLETRKLEVSETCVTDFLKSHQSQQLTELMLNHDCSLFLDKRGERVALTIERHSGIKVVKIV